MKIVKKSNQNEIADNVKVANNPITRFVGLLNRSSLNKGEGLWIVPCNSIHSFGMKFKFDAVFIDKNNQVKHLVKNMDKWKASAIIFSAHSVLELPAGTIDSENIEIDDILEFIK